MGRIINISFVYIFVSLVSTSAFAQNTWYVNNADPNCSDSAIDAGTVTKPFCSIRKANSAHSGGDTVYIMPGEYREKLKPAPGPSASQKTKYIGYGSSRSEVKLLGSEPVTGWVNVSGNIYKASYDSGWQCRWFRAVPSGTATATYLDNRPECNYDASNSDAFCTIQDLNCWESRSRWYLRPAEPQPDDQSLWGGGTLSDMFEGTYFYDEAAKELYVWPYNNANPNDLLIECSKNNVAEWLTEYTSDPHEVYNTSLENVTIMQTIGSGITMSGNVHDVDILDSEFAFTTGSRYCGANPAAIYHGSDGSYSPHAANINVIGNIIHDTGSDKGPAMNETDHHHSGTGIKFYDVDGSMIADNDIYRTGWGMDIKVGNGRVNIKDNRIHNTAGDAIRFAHSFTDTLIDGNAVFDIPGTAIRMDGWGDNTRIYHNVVYNALTGIHISLQDGQWTGKYDLTNTDIRNNIFMPTVYEYSIHNNITPFNSDFNLFWHLSSSVLFNWYGAEYGMSQWQANTGFDGKSIDEDPLLSDPVHGDFSIKSSSKAKNVGVFITGYHCQDPVEISTSQSGCRQWSGSAPDMGAIEVIESMSDTTAPVISGGLPTGTLPSGTTSAAMSVHTDENSVCKYEIHPGVNYDNMRNTFESTGGKNHSQQISGLSNGNSYTYYIKCRDASGNSNLPVDDYVLSFSVDIKIDDTPAAGTGDTSVDPQVAIDSLSVGGGCGVIANDENDAKPEVLLLYLMVIAALVGYLFRRR